MNSTQTIDLASKCANSSGSLFFFGLASWRQQALELEEEILEIPLQSIHNVLIQVPPNRAFISRASGSY